MSVQTHNLRLEVTEIHRNDDNKLELVGKTDDKQVQVLISGCWTRNNFIKGAIVHVIDPNQLSPNTYEVDGQRGLVVVDPDNLLTCTLIASALFCERKTWLNNVFLGQVGTNKAMLVGTIVHECFQHGLKNQISDIGKLTEFLDELLDDATVMLEIYSVEKHLTDIRSEAIDYLSSVREWIERYMSGGSGAPLTNEPNLEVRIVKVSDIEENVWSTKYGLKGKIDVTGLVRVHDKRNNNTSDKIIPLELKTGNPNLSSSHAAQVSLYSMMIEDRYAETNQGFVIYLKDRAAMHNVQLTHNIRRDLIQRRNDMNHNLKSYFYGPEMLNQSRVCSNCERLTECILMSNMYQPSRIDEYSYMKTIQSEATGHLDDKFLAFFQEYHEKLVTMLSASDMKLGANNSFWTYSSTEAEKRGTGFGMLQAFKTNDDKCIKFKRHPKHLLQETESQPPAETLTKLDAPVEREIIVIDDDGLGTSLEPSSQETEASQRTTGNKTGPSVKRQKINDFFTPMKRSEVVESLAATGTYKPSPAKNSLSSPKSKPKPFDTSLNFSRCRITISLDEADGAQKSMDSQNSTTAIAIGFMNELKESQFTLKLYEGSFDLMDKDAVYRVDKLEKRTNLDVERVVLVRLLARDNWRCDKIRRLILDPEFKPKDSPQLRLSLLSECFEQYLSKLVVKRHQTFVLGAVCTDYYYVLNETIETDRFEINKLISLTVALIVEALSKTVLIVSTNIDSLIDLMRCLQNKRLPFILIDDGSSAKARYQFASHLVKVAQVRGVSIDRKFDAYIRAHEKAPIVITSYAMSVGGLQFTRRTFDYCVAYDCGKTELLIGLSPMFCSDKCILIDSPASSSAGGNNCDTLKHTSDVTLGKHLRSLRPQQATK